MDPIRKLTDAARIMEKGELDVDTLDQLLQRRIDDEVGELTRVFKQMAEAVQLRERRLKEEVIKLRIQIDTKKRDEEVAGALTVSEDLRVRWECSCPPIPLPDQMVACRPQPTSVIVSQKPIVRVRGTEVRPEARV